VEERDSRAYVAEFIGTFILVLSICMVVSLTDKSALGYTDFAVIGLVHAFALSMLVYTLGGVSGGHFNPAVTAVMTVIKKIKPADAVIYIVVQLLGALAAAYVCKLFLLDEGRGPNYGAATVSKLVDGKALTGLLAEIIGTFLLVWAIMGTAVNEKADAGWAGWVIGATLGFAVMIFAPISGAGFNPARWFGPAIASGTYDDAWIYIVGPVVGAVAAGLVYSWVALGGERRPVDVLPPSGAPNVPDPTT
jgi:MIP family channel proteins